MKDNGYSITLMHEQALALPSVVYICITAHVFPLDTPMCIGNFQYPKGIIILSWGRLYNTKPTLHNSRIHTTNTYAHTPVYHNGTYFCFLHNTNKHKKQLRFST